MSTEIIIKHLDSNEISRIISEMKEDGITVGKDFDFYYSTGRFDWVNVINIPRQTRFVFYNESYASLFILRWC